MSIGTLIFAPSGDEIRAVLQDRESGRRFFTAQNKTAPTLDLDKSWHGLHYLLTGSACGGEGPLAFLINGGDLIDLEMSSARLFRPQQVGEIDAALAELTTDELRRRFDSQLMLKEEIYPEIWARDPKEDDTLEWLVSNFEQLKRFTSTARSEGRGLAVVNEWPAETNDSTPRLSQRRTKRVGRLVAVSLCLSVAACLYVVTPRPKWPFVVEAAFLYMIAALVLGAGSYFAKQFLGSLQARWLSYWWAAEDSMGLQGLLLLVLFIVAKLFRLL